MLGCTEQVGSKEDGKGEEEVMYKRHIHIDNYMIGAVCIIYHACMSHIPHCLCNATWLSQATVSAVVSAASQPLFEENCTYISHTTSTYYIIVIVIITNDFSIIYFIYSL